MERRKRAEIAVTTFYAECSLARVSTRRMDKLVKTLGIRSLSRHSSLGADLIQQSQRTVPPRDPPQRQRRHVAEQRRDHPPHPRLEHRNVEVTGTILDPNAFPSPRRAALHHYLGLDRAIPRGDRTHLPTNLHLPSEAAHTEASSLATQPLNIHYRAWQRPRAKDWASKYLLEWRRASRREVFARYGGRFDGLGGIGLLAIHCS